MHLRRTWCSSFCRCLQVIRTRVFGSWASVWTSTNIITRRSLALASAAAGRHVTKPAQSPRCACSPAAWLLDFRKPGCRGIRRGLGGGESPWESNGSRKSCGLLSCPWKFALSPEFVNLITFVFFVCFSAENLSRKMRVGFFTLGKSANTLHLGSGKLATL